MTTKTISVRLEAYEKLRAAKRDPGESFSDVILRAHWDDSGVTAGAFLALVRERGSLYAAREIDALEEADRGDHAPEDKWARG